MRAVFLLYALTAQHQLDPLQTVDAGAVVIDRSGYAAIVATLIVGIGTLFIVFLRTVRDKDAQIEKLNEKHGAQTLAMTEKLVSAVTEANLNTRKIEQHLTEVKSFVERAANTRTRGGTQ